MKSNPFSFATAREPASPALGLHALMGEVLDLESQLAAARERYRAAILKAGQGTGGIFSSCEFISRSIGELWREEARRATEKDNGKDLEPGPGAPDSPEDDEPDDEGEDAAETVEQRRKRKQKKVRDDLQDTTTSPPSDPREASYWRNVRATAAMILAAHEQATGGAPAAPSRADCHL